MKELFSSYYLREIRQPFLQKTIIKSLKKHESVIQCLELIRKIFDSFPMEERGYDPIPRSKFIFKINCEMRLLNQILNDLQVCY